MNETTMIIKLVVFGGSGSRKSLLVFNVIAVERSRQWQSLYPLYVRNKIPYYERPKKEFTKKNNNNNNVLVSIFSFNSKRCCEECKGTGHIVYEESVKVVCEECQGHS
ncbi:hypothetical protein U3516DRAFT_662778 [Neocallimastix sp. 'constans']